MTFSEFLSRFPGARKHGKQWQAKCPAHDDRKASLCLSEGADGRILLKCQAGCETDSVCAALGLTTADLFAEAKPQAANTQRQIVAIYAYRDETGALLFQTVRFEPKNFSQRQPDGNGGWRWNLQGVRRVLYRLPELLAADPGATIFLVEGEKDVERLRSLGLVATCNPMGAGKWRDEYNEPLRGRPVVIIEDNDQAGREHAAQVARSLSGIAASVKVLRLPGLPDKGDVSDWLDAGSTVEQLLDLAAKAPEWTVQTEATRDKADDPPLRVVRMADVEPETVNWLWFPYIPFGKLTLVEGDPGVGKSWLTCAIAAAVAAGRGLPGMETTQPRNVLMLSAEDGLGDTIRPRLDSMEADIKRIYAVDEPVAFDTAGLLRIEAAIIHHQPALVTVDPLVAFLGADVDMHRANETRAVMTRLAEVATRHQCAVAIVRHLSKAAGGKAIYRGQGSIDFLAAVRSSLLIGCDPNEPAKRAIVQIKNNLEAFGKPLGYEIRDGQFWWTGESDLTADKILSLGSKEEQSTEISNARADAEDFLRTVLADGPCLATDVEKEAREAKLSFSTLRRAKDALGVKSRQRGFGRDKKWYWELPSAESSDAQSDAHTDAQMLTHFDGEHLKANGSGKSSYVNGFASDAHFEKGEHLRTSDSEHLKGKATGLKLVYEADEEVF